MENSLNGLNNLNNLEPNNPLHLNLKNNKKLYIIIGGAVLGILLIVIILLAFRSSGDDFCARSVGPVEIQYKGEGRGELSIKALEINRGCSKEAVVVWKNYTDTKVVFKGDFLEKTETLQSDQEYTYIFKKAGTFTYTFDGKSGQVIVK